MADVIIDNPIINSAFAEPQSHFRFSEDGITNEVVQARRKSSYFIPIAAAKKQGGQKSFETEWTEDRLQENPHVDRMRDRVKLWRTGNYAGVTPTTRRLLEHWTNPERENKLFFCQIEALETAIYLAECAAKFGDGWMADTLREANEGANPGLPRVAFKMATGSGKTVVMAMLIAWQVLNKVANRQDARFTDSFLLVAPGITIRDRLRVLLPNDSENYYRQRDLVPGDLFANLNQAQILITNFHAFQLREKVKAPKLTKKFLAPTETNLFREAPDEMVRRVCKEFGNKRNIVVINDEAHHCYRRRPDEVVEVKEVLKGEDKKEAEQRNEEARIWINGIEAIKRKLGVKTIYDLSATPFFLRGSGYGEGTLFPWVVSDFSLIDAIESGVVKVPRVPVSDNSMVGDMPAYRDLWLSIRDSLPKKGRGTEAAAEKPNLPKELEGALRSLYENYEKSYRRWEESDARQRGQTPPVFIVVCNNTNVSKMVYDYISGWEKRLPSPLMGEGPGMGVTPADQASPKQNQPEPASVLVPGQLAIFSNVKDGKWLHRPNTILVDSQQLESGESMTPEFKKIAAQEIEEFKNEYRARFPGKDADKLTDEDILREVMNTVGKPGKLGEHVKCVVSVSMLTEGWDANTVTHILGVRAFGTQLLCEQVVGRGLRRMSYAADENGMFEPEYAEVYGVPFSFIPCSGATKDPKPRPPMTRVRALESRAHLEIAFPRLIGYRFEIPSERLDFKWSEDSQFVLSTQQVPTKVEMAPIFGQTDIHTLDDLRSRRENEVAFLLAKLTLERYFTDNPTQTSPTPNTQSLTPNPSIQQSSNQQSKEPLAHVHLFPQILGIAKRWLAECVHCKDGTFPQLLLLHAHAYDASDKIYRAIVRGVPGEPAVRPIFRSYDPIGSTRYVDFDTGKPTYQTDPDKCHVSHVVADTDSWEQKMAQVLEDMPEVVSYVKNQNLGFTIPYTIDGVTRDYYPDFIAVVDPSPPSRPSHQSGQSPPSPQSSPHPLHLIIEVSGQAKRDKAAKVATAQDLWIPAVNHAQPEKWAFVEITDPWEARSAIVNWSADTGKKSA